jgi:predicted secreted hydrolase
MQTSARYWEGAVTTDGDLTGVGYLEMVGYGDQDR